MNNILELFYDLQPDKEHASDSAYARTARIRLERMELLDATMSDQQKQLLDAYFEASSDANDLIHFDRFRYAFHLGAQLMAELIEGKAELLRSST